MGTVVRVALRSANRSGNRTVRRTSGNRSLAEPVLAFRRRRYSRMADSAALRGAAAGRLGGWPEGGASPRERDRRHGRPRRACTCSPVRGSTREDRGARSSDAGIMIGVAIHTRWAPTATPSGGSRAAARLGRPIEDTVFFAGEAADTEGRTGTVHGAIGTGDRAAELVLRLTSRRPRVRR